MSASPYFFVEKFNSKSGKYEIQHPYVWDYEKEKLVQADLFPYNGCHDMFSIVEAEHSYSLPKMHGIKNGLPKDVSEDILKAYLECSYDFGDGDGHRYEPNAHYFTYADMYIYLLEHPKVEDYDNEWYEGEEIPMIDNPLFGLKSRVDAFFEVIDDWGWKDEYSNIRIVYWVLH